LPAVEKAHFVVPLADLERGPKHVEWSVSSAWLRRVLQDTEATPVGDGSLEVDLTKSGRRVMVRGRVSVPLSMPCARTLEPVPLDISPEIFLLLSPAPNAPAEAPRARTEKRHAAKGNPARPTKRARSWEEDPELGDEQAAQDTYDGERVELDRYVREFILLELPMVPMQKELRDAPEPAIARPSGSSGDDNGVDPRLAPLAALASRLRQNKE
jgi:uncharacterized metal-binding protein YceD (DUF177 family)